MEPDLRGPEEKMASFSPWKRGRPESWGTCKIVRHSFWEKFDNRVYANMDLDIDTKRVALKASPFVVSLVSLAGGELLCMGSGTIVDCEAANGAYSITILASAGLLGSSAGLDVDNDIEIEVRLSDGTLLHGQVDACDFHYNLALIKIQHEVMVQPASLRILDDSISTHPCRIQDKGVDSESFQLRPHSDLIRLCPGDVVVALGRYFEEPYEIMAAPGRFSLDSVEFDCKELFRANCKISKCGIGGPLINRYGDVIGVNFYDELCTPFLPINIVLKWLEHFKKYGRFFRPCLGMQMTNLCAARPGQLEKIIQKFPNMSEGVLVEEVIEGSPAEWAGILHGDVIVQCAGKFVRSFLEFCGVVWDKAGKSVKVVVIRKTSGARLKITVNVDEINPGNFYRWPLPEKRRVSVNRVRR
ncbi:putative protease Do-like 14 [Rhododendron vialii]|uniref:putative protease Do-like 14 n=1 Tax=Rhododendron vialii TaxID=182163 RepID=UPI0026602F42|nr:putative protease Do-like 14 [Rhododendron vialii]